MNRSKTVLLTGAAGFLGRNLLPILSRQSSFHVISSTRRRMRIPGTTNRPCRLDRPGDVRDLLASVRPDIIFHCAGTTQSTSWSQLYRAHVTTTRVLFNAASELSLQDKTTFVVAGSAAEYGEVPSRSQPILESEPAHTPLNSYARSKYLQEKICSRYSKKGIRIIYARLFNLIGNDQPSHFAIPAFLDALRTAQSSHQAIHTGSLQTVRDFVAVEEACQALVVLGRKGTPGEIYNICSGRPTQMRAVFLHIVRRIGLTSKLMETSRGSRRTSIAVAVGNPRKIYRDTGWKARISWESAVNRLL